MKLATTIALLLIFASTVAQSPMPNAAAIYAQGVPWDQYLAAAGVQRETWLAIGGPSGTTGRG
jgi:hypothetical protein